MNKRVKYPDIPESWTPASQPNISFYLLCGLLMSISFMVGTVIGSYIREHL